MSQRPSTANLPASSSGHGMSKLLWDKGPESNLKTEPVSVQVANPIAGRCVVRFGHS